MAKASTQTASYTVKRPLMHDGTKFAPGSTIDLTQDQFEDLPPGTVAPVAPAPQPAPAKS